jgi:hypothetical protein
MRITEHPIQPGTLTGMRRLEGGNKGRLFVLENQQSEKLVVKFQRESPAEAVAGTAIVRQVGASTPGVRVATTAEVQVLGKALEPLTGAINGLVAEFRSCVAEVGQTDPKKLRYALFMEFAEGITIKDLRDDDPEAFLKAICDPAFQFDLGRIAAADTFAGNPDRMFARRTPEGAEGWYHEKNLFLSLQDGHRAVAIDNAFAPHLSRFQRLPHGLRVEGTGVQFGSISSANQSLSETEAGHLFDTFLDTTEHAHPDMKGRIAEIRAKDRGSFIANFTTGTATAMQTLLTRGQGWKNTLSTFMADEEMLKQFRLRKRVLRQVATGVDPTEARTRAASDENYRKWVLTTELKMSEQNASELLVKGVQEYKKAKQAVRI